ncbi:MAG: hypothetical protein IKT08_02255 [Bacteroidales bacterium]|nr:hypothetical protein [Bacteroidales bacterium]
MKKTIYLFALLLVFAFASCGSKKTHETSKANNDSKVQEQQAAEVGSETVNLSDCDIVFFDNGKLSFYDSKKQTTTPYLFEKDSVVNCVFTQDNKLYYCVAVDDKIYLRSIDLEESSPRPQQLIDWGVPYEKCVTETYGTCSPLCYYAGRNMLGLWHEFSWDSYSLTEQKLYNINTEAITDWDWEQWEEEELAKAEEAEEEDHVAFVRDELSEYLSTIDSNYYLTDGLEPVCLTDQIEYRKYISDPDYYEGPEFEFVSSSPDNMKVLFMIILEWGDFPHGILCVSSIDGKTQIPLEDTDCTGFNAQWLDDGSLVYVGEEPLSPDDPDFDENWHYRAHCIKRILPDGTTEIIAHCGDFQMKSW